VTLLEGIKTKKQSAMGETCDVSKKDFACSQVEINILKINTLNNDLDNMIPKGICQTSPPIPKYCKYFRKGNNKVKGPYCCSNPEI
jgi:hypothetical protein